jgi:hypothetical protein
MGRIGEQHLVSIDQAFDPSGGLIEALRQPCNLVAALDFDARREIARPERFDATLQALEAPGETSHDRAGAKSNHKRDCSKEGREHKRPRSFPGRQPCNQPPSVREWYGHSRPGSRPHPTSGPTVVTGSGKRATGSGQRLVGAAEQRQIRAKALRQSVDRLLLSLRRRVRRGDKLSDDFAGNLEMRAEWANAREEVPKQSRREHDQNEACHDGKVDLEIKSSHPSLPVGARSPGLQSWALANT